MQLQRSLLLWFFSLAVVAILAFGSEDEDSCTAIPSNLQLPIGLTTKEIWQHESMIPLTLSFGQVRTRAEVSVSEMIQSHTKSAGSIAVVVRRPG